MQLHKVTSHVSTPVIQTLLRTCDPSLCNSLMVNLYLEDKHQHLWLAAGTHTHTVCPPQFSWTTAYSNQRGKFTTEGTTWRKRRTRMKQDTSSQTTDSKRQLSLAMQKQQQIPHLFNIIIFSLFQTQQCLCWNVSKVMDMQLANPAS